MTCRWCYRRIYVPHWCTWRLRADNSWFCFESPTGYHRPM
jgi:hypothetical protein